MGNPQIFVIVSGRGAEWGFAPLTHPDDFSNQDLRRQSRQIARSVLEQLPVPRSAEANALSERLSESGRWFFRRKQRLEPNQSEFTSFNDWLSFVRSNEGVQNAGGGITRYATADEINKIDLGNEVRQAAQLFRSLMEHIVADAPPTSAARNVAVIPKVVDTPPSPDLPAFEHLLGLFLARFSEARNGPFQKTEPLWNAMSEVKKRLEQFPAVRKRPDLVVNISVGQGNWAAVPWIA